MAAEPSHGGVQIMARVTVEDCVEQVPNRFELVLLAAHRARVIAKGSVATLDRDNDKNSVVALREIGEASVPANDMREGLIHSMQQNVEVDEPEVAAAPMLPADLRPRLGRDDHSLDTRIDTMTEDALLRAMKSLVPEELTATGERSGAARRFGYTGVNDTDVTVTDASAPSIIAEEPCAQAIEEFRERK